MTQPLSEETLERLEVKHRNCAETDHRCDAPQLIATIRGLEAENQRYRTALEYIARGRPHSDAAEYAHHVLADVSR